MASYAGIFTEYKEITLHLFFVLFIIKNMLLLQIKGKKEGRYS